MFEESMAILPVIWASMNSWFTPTVLFILLNLMIGTIAVTSGLASHKKPETKQDPQLHHHHHHHHHHQQQQPPVTRSPSLLQRLKSINFYPYRSPEIPSQTQYSPPQESHLETHTHYYSEEESDQVTEIYEQENETQVEEQRVEETDEADKSIDEVYSELQDSPFHRTKSDTEPASGEVPIKLPRKMKKSASAKSTFAHFEADDISAVESRRPTTMREAKAKVKDTVVVDGDDEEVDAKADDFINRFKQQLKLQKLDSINRYKEEIHARNVGK